MGLQYERKTRDTTGLHGELSLITPKSPFLNPLDSKNGVRHLLEPSGLNGDKTPRTRSHWTIKWDWRNTQLPIHVSLWLMSTHYPSKVSGRWLSLTLPFELRFGGLERMDFSGNWRSFFPVFTIEVNTIRVKITSNPPTINPSTVTDIRPNGLFYHRIRIISLPLESFGLLMGLT